MPVSLACGRTGWPHDKEQIERGLPPTVRMMMHYHYFVHFSSAVSPFLVVPQIRDQENMQTVLEQCARQIDAEHEARGGVDVGDQQFRIEEHQPIVNARRDRLAFLLLRDDLAHIQLMILLELRRHLVELSARSPTSSALSTETSDRIVSTSDLPEASIRWRSRRPSALSTRVEDQSDPGEAITATATVDQVAGLATSPALALAAYMVSSFSVLARLGRP